MLTVTYTGSLVEQAGARGLGPTTVWYGASTFTAPVVTPAVEAEERPRGGGAGRRGVSDDEQEVADEEAVILTIATWVSSHAR